LDDAETVCAAFGLDRKVTASATAVHADVHLVGLDLATAGYGRTQVVLERVAGDVRDDIDEPVVATLASSACSLRVGSPGQRSTTTSSRSCSRVAVARRVRKRSMATSS
jgi:hypothetical protein